MKHQTCNMDDNRDLPKSIHRSSIDYANKSESFPYGSCLFHHVWQGDPTHPILKFFIVLSTVVGLLALPFFLEINSFVFKLDGEWDVEHAVSIQGGYSAILVLFEETMSLSPSLVHHVFKISLAAYALLIIMDLVLGNVIGCRDAWLNNGEIINRRCYDDMFMEPARHGRLIRRPGNSLSNILYFFFSMCLLFSIPETQDTTSSNKFGNMLAPSDGMFAIMLLFLSIFSTMWHSSNTNLVHYFDLWSMDSCVIYLNVRNFCIAEFVILRDMLQCSANTARNITAWSGVLLFTLIIILFGLFNYHNYKIRLLHGAVFPLSARSRLMRISNIWGRGHTDACIGDLCAYAALPIIFITSSVSLQNVMFHTVGSALAGRATCVSLSLAWSYRMFERFVLDGCIPATFFVKDTQHKEANAEKNVMAVIGAALTSPTAVFHILTGVTLVTGYMHSRSLEESAVLF
mmetsp:Transcript_26591/g.39167  ORF Transcript_26591/g.39167 Transcript_26591/m.39167 type:complete len:459 (+) Transcript_26591:540-1916(+)